MMYDIGGMWEAMVVGYVIKHLEKLRKNTKILGIADSWAEFEQGTS
jgi:hypothetical protein